MYLIWIILLVYVERFMSDEKKYEIEVSGKRMSLTEIEFYTLLKENNWKVDSDGNIYENIGVGVVPEILDQWFSERIEYRKKSAEFGKAGDKEQEAFYERRQKRQKIFLNSVYGTLGLPIFRFYDRDNAEAVTMSGQEIIRSAEKLVNDTYLAKFAAAGVPAPAQDFVVYIDTDSLYMSASSVAKLENVSPSGMMNFTINWITATAERINRFYGFMMPKIFNVAPERNRIQIVADVVAKKALWVVKKRYAMLKVYDMEKSKIVKSKDGREGKLDVKGIDVVRSSFPKSFQKFASIMLDDLLRDVPKANLDERIMRFEETIQTIPMVNIAKTSSVRFISRDGNTNYAPSARRLFQFVSKSPAQVRAALAYNDLLKIWKLDKQFASITHSEKVKWVYLGGNDFFIEALAFKGDDTDPDEILNFISAHLDRDKMYQRELRSKLADIWTAIGWPYPSRASQLATKTFDFSEEF
jgi:hypothetical protein